MKILTEILFSEDQKKHIPNVFFFNHILRHSLGASDSSVILKCTAASIVE